MQRAGSNKVEPCPNWPTVMRCPSICIILARFKKSNNTSNTHDYGNINFHDPRKELKFALNVSLARQTLQQLKKRKKRKKDWRLTWSRKMLHILVKLPFQCLIRDMYRYTLREGCILLCRKLGCLHFDWEIRHRVRGRFTSYFSFLKFKFEIKKQRVIWSLLSSYVPFLNHIHLSKSSKKAIYNIGWFLLIFI